MFVEMEELTVVDMEAAQQLVQLSGGEEEEEEEEGREELENTTNTKNKKNEKKKKDKEEGEEEMSSRYARIKEEDEDGDEQQHRSGRRKRFRSLAAIYEATKPAVGDRDEEERMKKRVRTSELDRGISFHFKR